MFHSTSSRLNAISSFRSSMLARSTIRRDGTATPKMSVHEQRRYDSMVNMIFLCYRSQVDAYAAALLDHLLSEHFGADNVFRASRSIKPGEDYRKALSAAAERSSAM